MILLSKINVKEVQEERIKEIEKQMKLAAKSKRWRDYYPLKAEKEKIEKTLNR